MGDPTELTFHYSPDDSPRSNRNEVVRKLPLDVRIRFGAIVDCALRHELDELTPEKLDGLTVAEILDQFEFALETDSAKQYLSHFAAGCRVGGWSSVRRTAYRGKLNEVLSLSCPKCSQPLEIHFETNSPQPSGERKGCLKIKCTSCIAGTYWDGLSDAPEWIEAFGHTIQTRPS